VFLIIILVTSLKDLFFVKFYVIILTKRFYKDSKKFFLKSDGFRWTLSIMISFKSYSFQQTLSITERNNSCVYISKNLRWISASCSTLPLKNTLTQYKRKQAFANIKSFVNFRNTVANFYDRCIDTLQKINVADFYNKLLKENFSLYLIKNFYLRDKIIIYL